MRLRCSLRGAPGSPASSGRLRSIAFVTAAAAIAASTARRNACAAASRSRTALLTMPTTLAHGHGRCNIRRRWQSWVTVVQERASHREGRRHLRSLSHVRERVCGSWLVGRQPSLLSGMRQGKTPRRASFPGQVHGPFVDDVVARFGVCSSRRRESCSVLSQAGRGCLRLQQITPDWTRAPHGRALRRCSRLVSC